MLKRTSVIYVMVLVGILFAFTNQSRAATLWCEDWEGNWTDNWHADYGTWEVGFPTSGPNGPYNGQNCAATILNGNYGSDVSSSLIRHTSFVVPPAAETPSLRFWHWYSFSSYDSGKIRIKVVGTTTWEDISPSYTHTGSGVWTYPLIDLSPWEGLEVQIAFYFSSSSPYESSGWYIDDVCVMTGDLAFNNPEDWESGLGDWNPERGTWEVGVPTSGPGSAHGGENCAATVLSGNYHGTVSSRLTSPPFVVPSAAETPSLRFWHWYSFSSYDSGKVQIKEVGTASWQDISPTYTHTGSGVWTYPRIDLSPYEGLEVQIAFYFSSSSPYESSGWYIDDVCVMTGDLAFNNPEDWESGLGDWNPERGTWEVGVPTSGPGSAHGGENCAATVLSGNYHGTVSSRLTSPPFVVPSAAETPSLRFWHWYSFSSYDSGKVQIRVVGAETWDDILGPYTGTSSGAWTYPYGDLSPWEGLEVQIAFYFTSSSPYESSGWYIDDIEVSGNRNPYEPSSPAPADGATDVPLDTDLCWVGGDPDPEDTVTYDLYAGTSSPPPLFDSDLTDTCFDPPPGSLEECMTYYWKIVAKDNHGARTEGPEWSFTTICPDPVVPDIKANGSDDPLFVTEDDPVDITVSLEPGYGELKDWWIGAFTPFGTYWVDPSLTWVPSQSPISVAQRELFAFSGYSLLNQTLFSGFYTFFFVIDDNPDGTFDDMSWYDSVPVIVSEAGAESTQMESLQDFDSILKEKLEKLMVQ